ncbi:hypothetical protein [Candidatus Endomicrobiellum devescovinae]|uniref:hypothetical protein n=1 Tax=Candidatus Endomicrobiellum devescovinae TaxID=3242322 RepID=UPI002825FBFB|nr:hypothetical protein [Endomicrobium sp.]
MVAECSAVQLPRPHVAEDTPHGYPEEELEYEVQPQEELDHLLHNHQDEQRIHIADIQQEVQGTMRQVLHYVEEMVADFLINYGGGLNGELLPDGPYHNLRWTWTQLEQMGLMVTTTAEGLIAEEEGE